MCFCSLDALSWDPAPSIHQPALQHPIDLPFCSCPELHRAFPAHRQPQGGGDGRKKVPTSAAPSPAPSQSHSPAWQCSQSRPTRTEHFAQAASPPLGTTCQGDRDRSGPLSSYPHCPPDWIVPGRVPKPQRIPKPKRRTPKPPACRGKYRPTRPWGSSACFSPKTRIRGAGCRLILA